MCLKKEGKYRTCWQHLSLTYQTQPQITSLIPNLANCKIGMAAADKKMHNQISIMQIHPQNMQKFVLEKSGYANLSTEVHPKLGLDRARCAAEQSWTTACCSCQRF